MAMLPTALGVALTTLATIQAELMETVTAKSVLFQLANGQYTPNLKDVDFSLFLETRFARYRDKRAINLAPMGGCAAAHARSLRLDPVLLNIILDNVLSNAKKYGGHASIEATLSVELAQVRDAVEVVLDIKNSAGPKHAELLAMGEGEFNRIAVTAGLRAHENHHAGTSAGDGFPMGVASARAFGGSLCLKLRETSVISRLTLPRVEIGTALTFANMDITHLSTAIVDDSRFNQRMLTSKLHEAFPSSPDPIAAGSTCASIDSFARMAVSINADAVFIDQHFGVIHDTKLGTDITREIRWIDGNATSRLIFIISADNSPEDIRVYLEAGADCHVEKTISSAELRGLVCQLAVNIPRLRARLVDRTAAE
jgi:CheY-like chemotaxis protein